jgi:SAM-dependent methyltransferase
MDSDAADADYADRLERKTTKRWKLLLDVQRPYRWNLRRLQLGRTLDVGCGVGRNLVNLPEGSVGVDFNALAVGRTRALGCEAYTTEDFLAAPQEPFDSILLSHLLEHLTLEESHSIVDTYVPYLRNGGRVIVICPQEKGYATPPTGHAEGELHRTFLDSAAIQNILRKAGLEIDRAYSFPFPRVAGKAFRYNETVVAGRKPTAV